MLTTPKSMATVVVVLAEPSRLSSTPTEAVVMSASVVSGAMSEIAPTAVVFPTPNPPAMTIFTGSGVGAGVALLECSKSTDHSHDEVGVVRVGDVAANIEEA